MTVSRYAHVSRGTEPHHGRKQCICKTRQYKSLEYRARRVHGISDIIRVRGNY